MSLNSEVSRGYCPATARKPRFYASEYDYCAGVMLAYSEDFINHLHIHFIELTVVVNAETHPQRIGGFIL